MADTPMNQDPTQAGVQGTQTPPAPVVSGGIVAAAQNQNAPQPPAAPSAAPNTQPPAATPQNQPHPLSRALDAVLKTATGGDVYYTDPNGQRKLAPQSRGTLGKTLIAATLAGLLSKDEYRQTPYGPVRDFTGSAGNAMAASEAKMNEMRNRPQKLSDEEQSHRLFTLQSNANLAKTMAASALQQHETLTKQIESSQPLLDDINAYESTKSPDQESARLGQHLTLADAQSKLQGKYTQWAAVPDGTVTVLNPKTGANEEHPTYSVVNPKAQVTISPETAEVFSLTNPQYKDINKIVGGPVKIPLGMAVAAQHEVNTLHTFQSFANSISKEFGIDPTNIMTAVRANRQLIPAIDAARDQIAAGGSLWRTLDAARSSKNGSLLLEAMGISPEKAQEYIQKSHLQEVSDEALAKEGGMGEKAPAAQEKITSVIGNINTNNDLNPDDRKMLLGNVPAPDKDGVVHMNNAQLEKLDTNFRETVATNKGIAEKNALANGDPVATQKLANNIIEGDVSNLAKVASYRGNARENAINAIHDEAEKRGLDTTQYSQQALENKANMLADYSGNKKSSTGGQISSFNAFLGHTAGAVDAEKRLEGKTLGLTRTPVVNMALDAIGKQLADDPDWIAYKTSLIPVQTEISNFLAAGYAVKAEDAALMQQAVDPHETPARITASLRQLAETADIRLAAMAQKYLDTMGTTYPNMLSADSANTLKKLNINSRTIPLSTPLPRGWKNNQASVMTDPKMAQAYVLAAGRDPKRAQDLAKDNGWVLQ